MQFPQVSGRNLERKQFHFPRDLEGEFNLLLVAFQRWQQQQVDSWLADIKAQRRQHPTLEYYELPVISERNALSRWFINEGMRAGIPNQESRQRTITLYIDKKNFKSALSMNDEADIYILLVDAAGAVHWIGRGWRDDEQAGGLATAIGQLSNSRINDMEVAAS